MVVFDSIRSSGIVAAKLLSKKYFGENRVLNSVALLLTVINVSMSPKQSLVPEIK